MNSSNATRAVLTGLALFIGVYGLALRLGGMIASERPKFPRDPQQAMTPSPAMPRWVSLLAPFDSGVLGSQALNLAFEAIQRGQSAAGPGGENDLARSQLTNALSRVPYDAELWLALALLEAQRDPSGPATVEALRMAYFTAPNEAELMAVRLDTATRFDALEDPDLRELAQGDVRLMLTRQPDQKAAVVSAYRRASNRGKAFLEEAIQTIAPTFLATLRR
ncbi:hypothetical protein [Bradyrhizobium iriomotense]|uniref:HEAT repeat domain-containing protein n=1 Tax=Bradyrhizobium iriomotense TaxID=441950 RepID=A0ABQ6B788_9BRAD|nr:hypothetical protein [Bradyrhizobium iriomotense]GLR88536.1 hypothetical protein GCM10007857_52480 [Bradyrhizobium iriomotense]